MTTCDLIHDYLDCKGRVGFFMAIKTTCHRTGIKRMSCWQGGLGIGILLIALSLLPGCHMPPERKLTDALLKGNIPAAIAATKSGADLNLWTDYDVSPLLLAITSGSTELVEVMLRHGADPNRTGGYGEIYLHSAASVGNERACELLLGHGLDPNATSSLTQGGFSPLFLAVASGHSNVASLLLRNGADPNQPNSNGRTPVHAACFRGSADLIKLLVEHGGDLHRSSKNGTTPMDYLRRKADKDLIDITEGMTKARKAGGYSIPGPRRN